MDDMQSRDRTDIMETTLAEFLILSAVVEAILSKLQTLNCKS